MNDGYAQPEVVDVAGDELAARQQRDSDLLAAIRQQESNAIGGDADDLSTERSNAIDYYLGKPFGNEIEGRSQVVSKDVFDTIEWIKPSLLRIFAGGDTIAQFQPEGEEDIQAAEQESDYVDYVIQRKNAWFMTAYEWFTDALLTRNAYCLAYWENKQEAVLERLQGLTEDQLALVAFDQNVQIISHSAYTAPPPIPAQMQAGFAMQGIQLPQYVLHDVEVRRIKDYGCVKVCTLPPERCLVQQDHKCMSVKDCDFFEYWEYKTITDLRNDGFDVPDDISDSSSGSDMGVVDQARDIGQNTQLGTDSGSVDPAMRKVKSRMIWLRFDYDGDGLAERRYVCCVGDTFLANQEITGTPVASIVPYPMPHRHVGLSMHDAIGDLQLIRSAMLRQVIDNAYLANNGRYGVDKNLVNLDDMAISRPGGMVRTDGPPGNSILPLVHPQTAAQGISVLQYLDAIRQDRGGVSKPMAGADLDAIMAQPGTVAQLTSAASQKIELIARIFAEGVKELFQIVHELTLTNATSQEKVELRGKWVTVDPRAWKKRNDMNLMVGLGVGNRQQHAAGISALMGLQKQVVPFGLTSPAKVYASLSEFTKALGFASGKQFFDEPPKDAKFQPPPDPRVEAEKIQAQADLMVQQMKNQTNLSITQMKEEAAAARSYFETMIDNQNQAQDRFVRTVSEITERMQEMRLDNARKEGTKDTHIQIANLDGVSEAVKKSTEASTQAAGLAKSVNDSVIEMKGLIAEGQKKKKRTVTTDKGRKYTISDE